MTIQDIKNFVENLNIDKDGNKIYIKNQINEQENNLLFNFGIINNFEVLETTKDRFIKGLESLFTFVRQRDGANYRHSVDLSKKKRVSMIERFSKMDTQKILEMKGI